MAKKQNADAKLTDYLNFLLTGEDRYSIEIKS